LRTRLGSWVVALWLLSTLALFARQFQELRIPQRAHVEIPSDDPEPVDATLRACRRLLTGGDSLVVVYPNNDVVQVYTAYRLAYLLYPVAVSGQGYDTPAGSDALALAAERGASHLLLLGTSADPGRAATLLASFGPEARLFRLTKGGGS